MLHTYYYAGGRLLREVYGNTILDFAYDASGNPFSLTINGVKYYYVTNLQGDVFFLVDELGVTAASYTYDPFGKVLTATGDIAEINPLRYRGYYYDTDSGFYYLQSRYYDPSTCRFINADAYASTGQGFVGNNMFAYCGNCPISCCDSSGRIAITSLILIGSAVLGAIAAISTAYIEAKADYDAFQIVGDSICSGVSTFLIVYTAGVSLYQCYENYCYLNSIVPKTDISITLSVSIPQDAYDTYDYVCTHNGTPPPDYKGGRVYLNDGRGGGQILPADAAPYREYDIHPHIPGEIRGAERMVLGSDGSAWYTNNHYNTFVRMEDGR